MAGGSDHYGGRVLLGPPGRWVADLPPRRWSTGDSSARIHPSRGQRYGVLSGRFHRCHAHARQRRFSPGAIDQALMSRAGLLPRGTHCHRKLPWDERRESNLGAWRSTPLMVNRSHHQGFVVRIDTLGHDHDTVLLIMTCRGRLQLIDCEQEALLSTSTHSLPGASATSSFCGSVAKHLLESSLPTGTRCSSSTRCEQSVT